MLAKLGCSYVVVGHSERREYHAETDELVNAKAKAALAAGITPIVCVGEGLEVRQAGEHVAYTLAPARRLAGRLLRRAGGRPGRGLRAGVGHRHRRGGHARRRAGGLCGDPGAASGKSTATRQPDALRILYGGSVKAANVAGIMDATDVDGALVGGASLQADEFGGICRFYDMPLL